MTVLGFLSIVTLVLEKAGFLDWLAEEIFGDDDESGAASVRRRRCEMVSGQK